MRHLLFALLFVGVSASSSQAASITLSIEDGFVILKAEEATAQQILAEWARIGKTQFVNLERLTGPPMTIQLERVPEKQALDIILRAVPGYVAAPREKPVANASIYDRVLVMATTVAVAVLTPPPQPPPRYGSPFQRGPTFTQLQPPNAPLPNDPAEPDDPALDQMNDPAIAAAAAAGLIPMPAGGQSLTTPPPGPLGGQGGMGPEGANPSQIPQQQQPPRPTNPWNAPAGTPQPSLAPPQQTNPFAPQPPQIPPPNPSQPPPPDQ